MGEKNEISWMQPAAAAAGGIVSQGMGLLLGAHNDRRQLRQQEKLQRLQMAGNKEMTDYQYQKQMEMWEKTGYGAQMDQMKAAGLNPGLMYGMSGGGGQTAGTGGGGGVSGGNAPVGGGEQIAAAGMGLQMAMMKGQLDVMASQAEKNRADAAATGGYQKDLAIGSIEKMAQETDNLRWQHEILRVDKAMKDLQLYVAGENKEGAIEKFGAEVESAIQDMKLKMNEAKIAEATQADKIKQIQAEAAGAVLKNALTKAQTGATEKGIEVADATMVKMATEMAQGWQALRIDEQEMYIRKYLAKVGASAIPAALMTDIVKTLGGIFSAGELLKQTKPQMAPVEGFGRGNKH